MPPDAGPHVDKVALIALIILDKIFIFRWPGNQTFSSFHVPIFIL